MTAQGVHDDTHLAAAAAVIRAMRALGAELEALGCHHRAEVEVCTGGSATGTVVYEDDRWRFRVAYGGQA